MTVEQTVRLAERHRRQGVVLDRRDQIGGVLDMRRPHRRVGHDRGRVLERIADLAVGHAERVRRIGKRRRRQVRAGRVRRDRIVRERHGVVIRTAVVGPGDLLLDQGIADGADRRRRQVRCHPTAHRSAGSRGWCC